MQRSEERVSSVRVQRERCPFCHDDIAANPDRTACPHCTAWHHSDCWSDHGGCSACGAGATDRRGVEQALLCESNSDCNKQAVRRFGVGVMCGEHSIAAHRSFENWSMAFAAVFVVAAMFPLTTAGARAAGFIFVAIAFVFALLAFCFGKRRRSIVDVVSAGEDSRSTKTKG